MRPLALVRTLALATFASNVAASAEENDIDDFPGDYSEEDVGEPAERYSKTFVFFMP